MSSQLFLVAGDDVIYIFTFTLTVFFLARFFIAGCTGFCYLTTSSVAGGWCLAGMMPFPFLFSLRCTCTIYGYILYMCVYKTISHYVFVIRQMGIAKSRTCNIVSFFFSWHPFILHCITDIGAHTPWLLAPFAIYESQMYYLSNCTNSDEWLCMKCCILNVMHCNKTYSLSLSLSYLTADASEISMLFNWSDMHIQKCPQWFE